MNIVTTGAKALIQSRYIISSPPNTSASPRNVIATLPDVSELITVVNTTEFPVTVTNTPGGGGIHAISSLTTSTSSSTPVRPISATAFPISRFIKSILLPCMNRFFRISGIWSYNLAISSLLSGIVPPFIDFIMGAILDEPYTLLLPSTS